MAGVDVPHRTPAPPPRACDRPGSRRPCSTESGCVDECVRRVTRFVSGGAMQVYSRKCGGTGDCEGAVGEIKGPQIGGGQSGGLRVCVEIRIPSKGSEQGMHICLGGKVEGVVQ
eukprot:109598-Chlamydomonas_euryale.AAC.4